MPEVDLLRRKVDLPDHEVDLLRRKVDLPLPEVDPRSFWVWVRITE